MPLIRQPAIDPSQRDAVVLHLGDLKVVGDHLKESARREAESILAAGRAERDRLVTAGRKDGHAAGHQQGLKEGREKGQQEGKTQALAEWRDKLAKLETAWVSALEAFLGDRERLMIEARQDVVTLAVMLAERVTKRALAIDPRIVADQMTEVLALVARPTRLVIAIHPADRPVVEEVLPALRRRFPNVQDLEIIDDASLDPGSCIARTANGQIDASINAQLTRIAETLLPAGPTTNFAAVIEAAAAPSPAESTTSLAAEAPTPPPPTTSSSPIEPPPDTAPGTTA